MFRESFAGKVKGCSVWDERMDGLERSWWFGEGSEGQVETGDTSPEVGLFFKRVGSGRVVEGLGGDTGFETFSVVLALTFGDLNIACSCLSEVSKVLIFFSCIFPEKGSLAEVTAVVFPVKT